MVVSVVVIGRTKIYYIPNINIDGAFSADILKQNFPLEGTNSFSSWQVLFFLVEHG